MHECRLFGRFEVFDANDDGQRSDGGWSPLSEEQHSQHKQQIVVFEW